MEKLREICPGFSLARKNNIYYILKNSEIIHQFNNVPTPDPYIKYIDYKFSLTEEEEGLVLDSISWKNFVLEEFSKLKLSINDAWELVDSMKKVGYNKDLHGIIEIWLYDRCGKIINEFRKDS